MNTLLTNTADNHITSTTTIKAPLINLTTNSTTDIELNSIVFNTDINPIVVARVIHWQHAKKRAGTHSTLTRSEVRGTTKKCKAQKEQGTRHGDKRAPIFRKGGITFGPKPRDYAYKLNKKVRASALRMVLTDKLQSNSLYIINSTDFNSHKTKDLQTTLATLGLTKALFISNEFSDNFNKAISNIPLVNKLSTNGLNARDMIKYSQLVISQSALDTIYTKLAI